MPGERTAVSSPELLEELKRTAANLALQPTQEPVLNEWYVAIDDTPTGPMTREHVRGHITAGRVDSESLVWREGFHDWRPLKETPDLADLLQTSRGGSPVTAPPPSRHGSDAGLRPSPSSGSGLAQVIPLHPAGDPQGRRGLERIGSRPEPARREPSGLVATPLRGRDVGRLGARPRPITGAVAVPMSPPPPTPAAEPSLADLVQPHPSAFDPSDAGAFAVPPTPGASPPPRGTAPPPPGYPGVEPALEPPTVRDPSPMASPEPATIRDPSGSYPAFDGAAMRGPSPSLMPAVHAVTAGRRRATIITLVVVAAIVGVVGTLVAVRLLSPQPVAVAAETGDGVEPAPPAPLVEDETQAPAEEPEEEPEEEVDFGMEGPVEGAEGRRRSGRGSRSDDESGGSSKNLSDEERRLLAQAKAFAGVGGPVSSRGTKSGSGDDGESSGGGRPLSPDDIRSTVAKNRGSIQRCYEREMRGTKMQRDLRVEVFINIGTSGTVRSAQVRTPQVRGTALGSCIESAVRRWSFPRATGSTKTVAPFVLTPRR